MSLSDAERFAELVDDFDTSPDGAPETEQSELLTLVSVLRDLDFDVSPSDQTRSRQRQRLVAMAAVRTAQAPAEPGRHRVTHGGVDDEPAGIWAALSGRFREAGSGRRVMAGIAGLSVIVAALGILALLAQSAIPGDTLYALKRGTEQARLVLAGNEQAEGRVLLGFASTRLDEIDKLLDEPVALIAGGTGVQAADGSSVAELLVSTMDIMDRQTTEGTAALTSAAVGESSLPLLQYVGEWGIEQFGALDGLTDRMPSQARSRATESKNLLQRVVERLELLAQGLGCARSGDPASDDLGPLPLPTCTEPYNDGSTSAAGQSGANSSAATGETGSLPTVTGSLPTVTNGSTSGGNPANTGSSAPSGGSQTGVPLPTGQGPGVPIPDPIPIPTQGTTDPPILTTPPLPPPLPPPPPPPDDNEGEPCVLIGFLGIQIPGIIIDGVCVGLGG